MEKIVQGPKVCFLLEFFYPTIGGIEEHSRNLAEKLIENGTKVFVVTRQLSANLPKFERIGRIPVHRIAPKGDGSYKKWIMMVTAMKFLFRMRSQYDIIYVHYFRVLGIPAVLACKLFRKKCVLVAAMHGEVSGAIFSDGLKAMRLSHKSPIVKIFLRLRNCLIRRADVLVSASSETPKEYLEGGISPLKIKHLPHGVDTSRFHPISHDDKLFLRQELELSESKKIVIFLGRLVSYKGLSLLISVWKEIAAMHRNAYLVLVGSGSGDTYDCESELIDYVKTHRLHDSVHFTGKVGSVIPYLQASDIFVFPSDVEMFPIALLEAMACGLPVIVRPKGGPKEIVTHLENGICADNFHELVDALDTLLRDWPLAHALGRAARKTVLESYDKAMEVQEYLKIFDSLK